MPQAGIVCVHFCFAISQMTKTVFFRLLRLRSGVRVFRTGIPNGPLCEAQFVHVTLETEKT